MLDKGNNWPCEIPFKAAGKLTLRRATPEDMAFLLDLRRQTMQRYLQQAGMGYSDTDHQRRVRYHFNDARIIQFDEQPVGLAKYSCQPGGMYLHQLQISPDYQGKGVATALITAWQQCVPVIRLSVIHSNPALALYQRLGFAIYRQDEQEVYMRWSL